MQGKTTHIVVVMGLVVHGLCLPHSFQVNQAGRASLETPREGRVGRDSSPPIPVRAGRMAIFRLGAYPRSGQTQPSLRLIHLDSE